MANYIFKIISDLQALINHKELNNVIEKTALNIQDLGCLIILGKIDKTSFKVIAGYPQIYLNINNRIDNKTILWDLFHEFGHHLDKDILGVENSNNKIERNRREKTAWLNADKEFSKFPELSEFKENYLDFRSRCLASYEIEDYVGMI